MRWVLLWLALAALPAHAQTVTIIGGSSPPSGAAGGDLTGTYPNPTVASIGGKAVTLGGAFTTSGAFATTLTATNTTTLTLPTTGTLATLAGSEALSNKTITASTFSGTTVVASTSVTTPTVTTASGNLTLNAAGGKVLTSNAVRLGAVGDNTIGNPVILWQNTGNTADRSVWESRISGADLIIRAQTDAFTAGTIAYQISRGTTYNVDAHIWSTSTSAGTPVERMRIASAGVVTYSSGIVYAARSPADAATVTLTPSDYYVSVITATQAVAANLEATPATGQTHTVCDVSNNGATRNITVTPAAGNIDAAGTFTINTNSGCWTGYYTGALWKTIASR